MTNTKRRIFWSDVVNAFGGWPYFVRVSVDKNDLVLKIRFRYKVDAERKKEKIQRIAGVIE